jgi:hypothetical protein
VKEVSKLQTDRLELAMNGNNNGENIPTLVGRGCSFVEFWTRGYFPF